MKTAHTISPLAPAFALALLLGGCFTAGPDYHRPAVDAPAAWQAPASTNLASQATTAMTNAASLAAWWTAFDDPVLTTLVARAQAGNLDVQQAAARLRAARAEAAIARGGQLPTLAASGSASRNRSSGQSGNGKASNLFANGLDASWELDLFGSQRRTVEAADAAWDASRDDLHDTLVTLVAEMALDYVALRTSQQRLRIAKSNLVSQTDTYDLAHWRAQAQLASQLDVEQARLTLEQTRAAIPALRTTVDQTQHQLDLLLGLEPGSLRPLLDEERTIPNPPASLAMRLPVDVIRQRPDIRRTERKLAAQTARIGVATAARYPSFTLSGSVGLEALEAHRLFTAGARTAGGAATAAWTLFDGGKIRQTIAEQTALRDEALALYQAAVLTALKDVEDALVAYANEQERLAALAAAATAARNAFNLARDRYASGLIDFTTLQTAQQALLSAEESQASSSGDRASDLIRLYKALGGGWTPLASDLSADSSKGPRP